MGIAFSAGFDKTVRRTIALSPSIYRREAHAFVTIVPTPRDRRAK